MKQKMTTTISLAILGTIAAAGTATAFNEKIGPLSVFADTFDGDSSGLYVRAPCGNPNLGLGWDAETKAARVSGVHQANFAPIGGFSARDGVATATFNFEQFPSLDGNANGRRAMVGLRVDSNNCDRGVWGGLLTLSGQPVAAISQGTPDGGGLELARTNFTYRSDFDYVVTLEVDGPNARLLINGTFVTSTDALTRNSAGNTGIYVASCPIPCEREVELLVDNWVAVAKE